MAYMANEIMKIYKERGEPGAYRDDEELKMKTQGGEPTRADRAEQR